MQSDVPDQEGAPALEALATDLVDGCRFGTGLQLSCRGPSASVDLAVGGTPGGGEVSLGQLFNIGCATKPFVSAAIGLLIDQDLLDPSRPVSSWLPEQSPFAAVDADLWSVLNHTAGLAEPTLLAVNLTPESEREELVVDGIRTGAQRYSSYTGSALLAEVVQNLSHELTSDFIETRMLMPLNREHEVSFGCFRASVADFADRIGLYVFGLPDRAVPMLHDRSPHQLCTDRVALGGYASARALADFYASLGAAHEGAEVAGVPTPTTLRALLAHPGTPRFEPDFHRTCSFSGGFMIDLPEHGYGSSLSASSFGHTGYRGSSFGFFDPATGVAGSAIINGFTDPPLVVDGVREALVDAMLESCSGADLSTQKGVPGARSA